MAREGTMTRAKTMAVIELSWIASPRESGICAFLTFSSTLTKGHDVDTCIRDINRGLVLRMRVVTVTATATIGLQAASLPSRLTLPSSAPSTSPDLLPVQTWRNQHGLSQ